MNKPPPLLSVGQTIFYYDDNRRKYLPGRGDTVWSYHWVPRRVFDETRMYWLLTLATDQSKKEENPGVLHRISKKVTTKEELRRAGFAFDENHLLDLEWVESRLHEIARTLYACKDPEKLRSVATALGMTIAPEPHPTWILDEAKSPASSTSS